jgi:hypothetical protein
MLMVANIVLHVQLQRLVNLGEVLLEIRLSPTQVQNECFTSQIQLSQLNAEVCLQAIVANLKVICR